MYAVKEHKAGALLLGGYGAGKTFLSRALRERCPGENFSFVTIINPRLSARELLEEINLQLTHASVPQGAGKPELLRIFSDALETNYAKGLYTVIIVDEVQSITDSGLLEELRLLMNVQRDDRILFTLVLLGQPSFIESLAAVPQFEHRISVRYILNSLNEEETGRYIRHRMEVAGQNREVFTEASAKLIYSLSGGVPRMINNICDLSLLAGLMKSAPVIDEHIVAYVSKDLADGLGKAVSKENL